MRDRGAGIIPGGKKRRFPRQCDFPGAVNRAGARRQIGGNARVVNRMINQFLAGAVNPENLGPILPFPLRVELKRKLAGRFPGQCGKQILSVIIHPVLPIKSIAALAFIAHPPSEFVGDRSSRIDLHGSIQVGDTPRRPGAETSRDDRLRSGKFRLLGHVVDVATAEKSGTKNCRTGTAHDINGFDAVPTREKPVEIIAATLAVEISLGGVAPQIRRGGQTVA